MREEFFPASTLIAMFASGFSFPPVPPVSEITVEPIFRAASTARSTFFEFPEVEIARITSSFFASA